MMLLLAACADSNLDSMEERPPLAPVSAPERVESVTVATPSTARPARPAQVQVTSEATDTCTQARTATKALSFGDDDWLRVGQAGQALARNAQGELFTGNEVVRKLRADGSQIWCAPAAGSRIFAVVALPDGGVLAAGERHHECTRPNSACYRDFITRLDADGGEVWSRSFTEPEPAHVSRVTGLAYADGLIYVAGQLTGNLSFQGETRERTRSDMDFFVLAIDEAATQLLWADSFGSPADDGDGPVLAAHPLGGVVAVGHMHDAAEGFVRAYAPSGETRWDNTLHGHVSLFQLGVDGRGHIWTSGVMSDLLTLDQAHALRATRGEYAALLLEYAPDGMLLSTHLFETPSTGGVRALGLAPRAAGVFFISDYGYPESTANLRSVTARLATVDAAGTYQEFDSFELWSGFSRHAAVAAGDSSVLWAGANVAPTSFGLDQGQFPNGSFLMHRSVARAP